MIRVVSEVIAELERLVVRLENEVENNALVETAKNMIANAKTNLETHRSTLAESAATAPARPADASAELPLADAAPVPKAVQEPTIEQAIDAAKASHTE